MHGNPTASVSQVLGLYRFVPRYLSFFSLFIEDLQLVHEGYNYQ